MTENSTTSGERAPGSVPDPAGARRVLIVSAHPDPRSLTASLTGFAADELRRAGHEVRISDLYAMKWKAVLDADDFPSRPAGDRLDVMAASEHAYATGTLTADVRAEQERLRWADAVILQFPLWWGAVPAILKGWLDRVLSGGFAYGENAKPPYGEGELAGRRALVSVTHGAGSPSLAARGIHGPLPELLFPLQHGALFFLGMSVLEPFAVPDAADLDPAGYRAATAGYRARLAGLFTEQPLPYRRLTDEEYTRELALRPGRERPGSTGFGLHLR
ncbi:NAD(P)H-dependent oxidoreductase [Streptomyces sp. DSM 44915]|uniref:NAD(P)H-dependent oxidoreductase n=1 Tax=Streptomyces chisholmiae TaxID=3075540 RepID=A0ABU2JN45_9ACTN|nr:NAD(P)H-dependent oxidoreductase [Streptomyces sp. DSM 44915]MDT0266397.1 NAD(P)H-dependent oxidoreductase [Streptomyces sp. DSM 44915]